MEILVKHEIEQTEKIFSLLCLLSLCVTGCSSNAKVEKTDPFLNGSIHINGTAPVLKKSISKNEVTPTLGRLIFNSAKSQLGIAYKFGGTSPKTGFDCSGLTWYSHKQNGIRIPRVSSDQFNSGKRISRKDLMPGDLVFFETYRPGASHVGIYKGNGNFIHSPSNGKKIEIQKLSNVYFKKRYLGARRYW